MTVDKLIVDTLSPLGFPVWNVVKEEEQNLSEEIRQTYFVFNYSTYGANYADDDPDAEIYLIQVHLFAPLGTNLTALTRQTKAALHGAGMLWPETVNSSDENGRHIVFETEYATGADLDGDLYV